MSIKQCAVRRDCFASKGGKCSVLLEELCRTGWCPFFKTKLQAKVESDRAHWAALCKGYYANGGGYVPKYPEGNIGKTVDR